MYTKHLDSQSLLKHMKATGMEARGGRSQVAPDIVRSKGKHDTLVVGGNEAQVDSLVCDDEVEEEDRFPGQRGTPWLRGGSEAETDEVQLVQAPSGQPLAQQEVEQHQFVQAPSGQPLAQQEVEQHMYQYRGSCRCQKRMSRVDMRDEGESGPASRRKVSSRECARDNLVLSETGTCLCQPRSGAQHQVSALMAGGEVQNIAPSFVVESSVAFSFCSHQRVVGNVIHTQRHARSIIGFRCEHAFSYVYTHSRVGSRHVHTHAQSNSRRASLTATLDIVAVGAQAFYCERVR